MIVASNPVLCMRQEGSKCNLQEEKFKINLRTLEVLRSVYIPVKVM